MKTFTAALLIAAVCLLAASGAVEASRVGPGRQLKQFSSGLGKFPSGLGASDLCLCKADVGAALQKRVDACVLMLVACQTRHVAIIARSCGCSVLKGLFVLHRCICPSFPKLLGVARIMVQG